MRDWTLSYYFDKNINREAVYITLEEAPWLNYFVLDITNNMCSMFPAIPLPPIPITIKDYGKTNLYDWFGTTRDLFHMCICNPLSCWAFNGIKTVHKIGPYEISELKHLINKNKREYL